MLDRGSFTYIMLKLILFIKNKIIRNLMLFFILIKNEKLFKVYC